MKHGWVGVGEQGTLTAANVEAVDVCNPFVHPHEVEYHRGLVRLRAIRWDDEGLGEMWAKKQSILIIFIFILLGCAIKRSVDRRTHAPWGEWTRRSSSERPEWWYRYAAESCVPLASQTWP